MVTHLRQFLASFLKAQPDYRLEEDRHWVLNSALERMDGRLAPEEHYGRVALETRRADETAGGSSGEKKPSEHEPDTSWRAEAERARSESAIAYERYLDTLFFYYVKIARAVEMCTRQG